MARGDPQGGNQAGIGYRVIGSWRSIHLVRHESASRKPGDAPAMVAKPLTLHYICRQCALGRRNAPALNDQTSMAFLSAGVHMIAVQPG